MLHGIFSPFGTVERVSIMKDSATNVSRGYAFVEVRRGREGRREREGGREGGRGGETRRGRVREGRRDGDKRDG